MANWLVLVSVSVSVLILVTFMREAEWGAKDLCVLCNLGGGVSGNGGGGGFDDEVSVIDDVIDFADFCDEDNECVDDVCVSVW